MFVILVTGTKTKVSFVYGVFGSVESANRYIEKEGWMNDENITISVETIIAVPGFGFCP